MADTVYLSDGSMEIVFGDKETFLERLLDEKLGRDAANCFRDCIDEIREEMKYTEEDAKEKEQIADGYRAMCMDAVEVFKQLEALANAPRLDRQALLKTIKQGHDDLFNNL